MKLIIGLGNIGKEYENTRHNVGFMVLDSFTSNYKEEKKFQSYITEEVIGKEKVIFAKPTTYMNLSGIAVKKIMDFYKIKVEDILIIQDDMDLKIGTYKLKKNSSAGGHNGIKSIISSLQTDSFFRLKVGIGHETNDVIDYVLGSFSKTEMEKLTKNFPLYKDIVMSFIRDGIEKTELHYSHKRG